MATPSEVGPQRVRAVKRAHKAAGLGPEDVLAVRTVSGAEVHIAAIETHEDGARSYVDVTLAGVPEGGDPNFRIVNPPNLVPDPTGDVITERGRFRVDPIGAIAQVIAQNGGSARMKQRARGRG